ncbi:hypothetical protein NST04_31530 [Paenibacillus sp. FSL H7-0756]|uniref:hypothetical protein n=1 Tax=Paenibacillus sp. FSL H3-0469 TaxID=2954506 RepID=UPI0030FD2E58
MLLLFVEKNKKMSHIPSLQGTTKGGDGGRPGADAIFNRLSNKLYFAPKFG